MPIVSALVRFFRRLAKGRKGTGQEETAASPAASARVVLGQPAAAADEKAAASAKSTGQKTNLIQYKRSIQSLIAHYVPSGQTIEGTLEDLAEKWNPLYDARAKRDLVDDVNALVRDFIRPIRRSFLIQPPDLRRIHALAEQLAESKSLVKIKKREILKNYIELYMVRSLEVKSL